MFVPAQYDLAFSNQPAVDGLVRAKNETTQKRKKKKTLLSP
jgi:hypothetical protein